MLDLESAIKHYEQLAENQMKCADRIDEMHCDSTTTRYMAEHHRQLAEWLRELKKYRRVRTILSQNRIATDRYGEVVLWDDIKRVFEEVNADDE